MVIDGDGRAPPSRFWNGSCCARAAGGRLEAFYFAFGETDVFVVVDGVDAASAAALALTVAASGAAHPRTTVLLTPEEVDQACRKSVSYRAPGS